MWSSAEHDEIVKTLALVCEATGTTWSKAAQLLVVKQLSAYPARWVLGSLMRCNTECRFKLTLADVVQRLDDGRPGAEEAWANFPKTEDEAGVVTEDMSVAWGAAVALYKTDEVAARMAWKEVYEREVRTARANGIRPTWRVSPGFSKSATEGAVLDGLRRRLVAPEHAAHFVSPARLVELLHAARLGPPALPAADLPLVKALMGKLG